MQDTPAEEPENSLRADLEAAYEASENVTAAVEQPKPEPESSLAGDPGTSAGDTGGDASGTAAGATPDETKAAAKGDAEDLPATEGSAENEPQPAGTGLDGPPVALSPEAREAWKDTPKVMQSAIAEREREYTMGLQKHADNAARAVDMDRALEPFRQYMGMAGGPPAQVIGNLLQTASILQMGSPVQRAQQVATLITQFGVNIDALAAALDGAPQPAGVQRESEMTTAINTALKPYQEMLSQQQQFQQQQYQQGQQVVDTDIQAFAADAKNEFYNDVKIDMADIFDLAEKRGIEMTMPEAYRRACLIRPDIQAIVKGRAKQHIVDSRRTAASSIHGTPGGSGGGPGDLTLRDQLSNAWDEAARQG